MRERADCVCFHDVDYLPVWADCSRVRCATSLIAWGVAGTPGSPSNTPGCVLALPVADFARINGYGNDDAGWGHEDGDLKERIRCAGIAWERRGGTFTALPHPRQDYLPDGTPQPEAALTAAIFARKLTEGDAGFGREGLSALRFRVTATAQWQRNGVPQPHVLHHHIAFE